MPQRAERGRKVLPRLHDMNRAVLLLWQVLLLLPRSPHLSALCLFLCSFMLSSGFSFFCHTHTHSLSCSIWRNITVGQRHLIPLLLYGQWEKRRAECSFPLPLRSGRNEQTQPPSRDVNSVSTFYLSSASKTQSPTWPLDTLSLSSHSRPSVTLPCGRLRSQEELPLSWFPIRALAYALM